MSEYTFTENELNDLQEVFFIEAYEILQFLSEEILNLESGKNRAGSLRNIQRHLHTLKGNSRALGFIGINTLTHRAEDLLKAIQDSGIDTDQSLIDVLFEVNDELKALVDSHRKKCPVSPNDDVIRRIDDMLSSYGYERPAEKPGEAGCNQSSPSLYDISVALNRTCDKKAGMQIILQKLGTIGEVMSVGPCTGSAEPSPAGDPGEFTVRLGTAASDQTLKDLLTLPEIIQTIDISLQGNGSKRISPVKPVSAGSEKFLQTVRVDAQRIDKILNLVGELVIGRSMVGQALSELGERYKKDGVLKKLGDANAFMEKTLSQLQKNVMKIRMHPILQIFRKFPRVVRDLAQEQQKQVELVMTGEKTELDKSILDVIGEPLIHLVRNAVDHGIEPPDERERAGKSRTGLVKLRADHEGNQIVIEVSDDGRGLDPELLRKKAVEKGIKTAEEAARLTNDEAFDLVFVSGFSTAPKLTDISGRGLGMDIVRATVESLKGRIQVSSIPGQGTAFTLRLPLTLAIIRAMLFWVNNRLLALPMSSIEKIVSSRDSLVQTMTGKNVFRYRDKVISLISLEEVLNIPTGSAAGSCNKYIIIVGLGDRLYGFAVNRLVGQQELVIKVLDDHWKTINCTSGASVLGNGRIVLILDAPAIIMKELGKEFVRS